MSRLPNRRCVVCNTHQCIKLVVHVDATVRWNSGGHETRYETSVGDVGLWPADGRDHAFVIVPARPTRSFVLLVPTTPSPQRPTGRGAT